MLCWTAFGSAWCLWLYCLSNNEYNGGDSAIFSISITLSFSCVLAHFQSSLVYRNKRPEFTAWLAEIKQVNFCSLGFYWNIWIRNGNWLSPQRISCLVDKEEFSYASLGKLGKPATMGRKENVQRVRDIVNVWVLPCYVNVSTGVLFSFFWHVVQLIFPQIYGGSQHCHISFQKVSPIHVFAYAVLNSLLRD